MSAKIKEDFVSEKQLEVWENVSKNTLKTTNQKLNLKYECITLYKNSIEHHNGRKVVYELKIIAKCLKDPLKRQISESECLNLLEPDFQRWMVQ